MLLYLKDGKEGRTIRFTCDEVQNYCELFNLEFTGIVPTLMCAKLWPDFKIYNSFINKTIVLVETQIKEIHKLVTNEIYQAILSQLSKKTVRNIVKYTYRLEINKNENTCINIEQTFIEVQR